MSPIARFLLLSTVMVVLPVLLAWAVAEVYVRATRPYVTPALLREQTLEYESSLFARTIFPRREQVKVNRAQPGAITVSARGYRGREFSPAKPEGITRVVFLGGSSVFDIYASEDRDWPRLVEQRLHAQGLRNVEVINAAIPGHASWESFGRLYSEIWTFDPDYVVVYHAWNDIKYFGWISPDSTLLRAVRPAPTWDDTQLVANPFVQYQGPLDRLLSHSQVYVRLRARYFSWRIGQIQAEDALAFEPTTARIRRPEGADTFSTWGPRQFQLNLQLIADATRNIGAEPVFLVQARLPAPTNTPAERERTEGASRLSRLSHEGLVRAFAVTDQALVAAAAAENVPILDLSARFTGRGELFADHVHTTAAGSDALAEAVASFLASLMRGSAGEAGTASP